MKKNRHNGLGKPESYWCRPHCIGLDKERNITHDEGNVSMEKTIELYNEKLMELENKLKHKDFVIRWYENENMSLENINAELNAENEALETLLEYKLKDIGDERYEYIEDKNIYIHDTLSGEKFYMSDLDDLARLLNNYSQAIRKMI